MYDTILFPTDGSRASMEALDHAVGLADTHGATLHALYVVDTSYPYGDMDGLAVEWDSVLDALRQDGERAIAGVEERAAAADVPVVGSIVEESVIYRAILDRAAEIGADLIVMGTHGRRGPAKWLLGSVAERVVRRASIPVTTVRMADDDD